MCQEIKKSVVVILVVTLHASCFTAFAQRRPCVVPAEDAGPGAELSLTRAVTQPLEGDVRVPIILAAYTDVDFHTPQIQAVWDAMANQPGYAEHGAAGCVADYFRQQSLGRFRITFDVLGPVVLPNPRAYYGENRNGDDRRRPEMIKDACRAVDSLGLADFSRYDWDGDGVVDALLVVFAGNGENNGGPDDAIWPHMSTVSGTVGDMRLWKYACVSELWDDDTPDGYGTLCHEFSHCLGIPDLYPVSGPVYSIFDQWDLMDGGNYTNKGWSPPHYSAFERYLCGWLDFVELTSPAAIADMPPLDDQPLAYVIRNDNHPTEYYILENRQQRGFDYFLPGAGLLVTHVMDYNGSMFPNNASHTQVDLVYADNCDYATSKQLYDEVETGPDGRCNYLDMAAYPYVTPDFVNDRLTDQSVPAATLQYANADGTFLLSKPVTNIRMDAAGKVSFDFMMSTAIHEPSGSVSQPVAWYDLQGRRLPVPPRASGLYIVRYSDGTTKKRFR